MSRATRRLIVLALVALVGGTVAVAGQATTGDLLQGLADARALPAQDAATAVHSLTRAGYSLPALDYAKPLTEADVVRIASALGIRVTTSRPDAPFSSDQLTALVRATSKPDPVAKSEHDNGADPLTKGNGKKLGLKKRSPSDPAR